MKNYKSPLRNVFIFKTLKVSFSRKHVAFEFLILAFSTNFCHIKTDLSSHSGWPQASDFFCDFQTSIRLDFDLSNSTTSSCPPYKAYINAVFPILSFALNSMPEFGWSSSNRTTSWCLSLLQARMNGVSPSSSLALSSTRSEWSRSNF